jgi:hypothetical protein
MRYGKSPFFQSAREIQVARKSAFDVYRETVEQWRRKAINRALAAYRLAEAGFFAAEIEQALA